MSINLSTIISFITGLGVGSVIAAFVQHKLSRKAKREDSLFDERKSAFDGLLSAYAALAEGWSDSKAKQFALCEARIQLVGSSVTVVALSNLKSSEAGTLQRDIAYKQLIEAMRSDLDLT